MFAFHTCLTKIKCIKIKSSHHQLASCKPLMTFVFQDCPDHHAKYCLLSCKLNHYIYGTSCSIHTVHSRLILSTELSRLGNLNHSINKFTVTVSSTPPAYLCQSVSGPITCRKDRTIRRELWATPLFFFSHSFSRALHCWRNLAARWSQSAIVCYSLFFRGSSIVYYASVEVFWRPGEQRSLTVVGLVVGYYGLLGCPLH